MSSQESLEQWDQRVKKEWVSWLFWQVLFPLVILILVGGMSNKSSQQSAPFLRQLLTGDLIILASVLMLGLANRLEPRQENFGLVGHVYATAAKFFALSFLSLVGLLKIDVIAATGDFNKIVDFYLYLFYNTLPFVLTILLASKVLLLELHGVQERERTS